MYVMLQNLLRKTSVINFTVVAGRSNAFHSLFLFYESVIERRNKLYRLDSVK